MDGGHHFEFFILVRHGWFSGFTEIAGNPLVPVKISPAITNCSYNILTRHTAPQLKDTSHSLLLMREKPHLREIRLHLLTIYSTLNHLFLRIQNIIFKLQ